MALNKANITWSAKQIAKMANNGTFTFDNIIQRSYVWEQSRKSELIHSMIEGYPIPPFYAKKVDGKVYDFLDGKQRMDAIKGYINDEYQLKDVPNVEVVNDTGETEVISIDGLKFSQLPEELQDAIKDYSLTIYYFENITDEQVRILFKKLNNGKPLSTKDRNIANCVDIKTLIEIGKHDVFRHILTEKSLTARKHLPMIMKIWEMLNKDIDDISFASKDFNETMKTIEIEEEERNEIVSVLDFFKNAYVYLANEFFGLELHQIKLIRKRIGSETHFISLMPFVKKAMELGYDYKMLSKFFIEAFGKETIVSDEYTEACKSGSAKAANIKIRHEELQKVWNDFMKGGENDEEAA